MLMINDLETRHETEITTYYGYNNDSFFVARACMHINIL